jgi:hypothetical protein
MAFVPYATRDELQAWAGVPGGAKIGQIDLVLDAASRAVDEYCQRHFWQDGTIAVPVPRVFVAFNARVTFLGPFNDLTADVAPVLATDTDGDGVFETAWTASDWQPLPANRPDGRPYTSVLAVGGLRFPCGSTGRADRVQVTGVWGWSEIPSPVKTACLIKATRLLTRMQSPNGIAGIGEFGPVRINRNEDGDVVSLLEPYRRVESLVTVA